MYLYLYVPNFHSFVLLRLISFDDVEKSTLDGDAAMTENHSDKQTLNCRLNCALVELRGFSGEDCVFLCFP